MAEVEAALRTGIAACGPSDAAELWLSSSVSPSPRLRRTGDADGADADAEAVEEAAAEGRRRGGSLVVLGGATASRGRRKAFGKRSERLPNLVLMVGLPVLASRPSAVRSRRARPTCGRCSRRTRWVARRIGGRVAAAAQAREARDRRQVLGDARRPQDAARPRADPPANPSLWIRRARGAGVPLAAPTPEIRFGGGKLPIASFADKLGAPAATEGFDAVHCVTSEAEGRCAEVGAAPPQPPPLGLFKFPRTRHVLNTGGTAVSRDDLVMDAADARRFFDGSTVVVAEEKVDGANLGLSLSADYEVRAQNRSHWVCSGSHAQFKGLDGWLDEHSWALCQLLVPEVEVLFGEWCYARHSVPYTRLPNYFIAFDIYNKRTGKFCAAAERDRRLDGLGIPQVRQVAARAFGSKEELLALLETRSAYTDGFVEGVYLRIDDAAHRIARQCVRPDFIQGIEEHWMAGGLVKNAVALGGADEEGRR